MRGSWGNNLKLTIFGESHGEALGMVIDGLPIGMAVDETAIAKEMARRAPGRDPSATTRKEADRVRIVSGVYNGRVSGAPLCGLIENTNTRSGDYSALQALMRPGHADYAGHIKYKGMNDPRGGGHFSGRLTAPLVFAGALARQALQARGIECAAHIASIADVEDRAFDAVQVSAGELVALREKAFALNDTRVEGAMRARIEAAKQEKDSVGGVIECAAVNVPAGWGAPFFSSVESVAASLLYSIPAVKSVEFGDGMAIAQKTGMRANDALSVVDGRVKARTNHNGGVTGGITNGMPILCRVAIKPTPSIGQEQDTVDLQTMENAKLSIVGRHDPCIVPRAVAVVESALLLALLELSMEEATR